MLPEAAPQGYPLTSMRLEWNHSRIFEIMGWPKVVAGVKLENTSAFSRPSARLRIRQHACAGNDRVIQHAALLIHHYVHHHIGIAHAEGRDAFHRNRRIQNSGYVRLPRVSSG